ncbi:MAG: cob(I)yrinic acid a,c-diamide adenosyltransferase [Bacteroidetes bacterium]|nr:cob(I)yrinic acid a,c-diamide adenosyltransferase [Bacteroidota bacterium]MBK6820972.1 cob(I)yrinic acid a,c-diamide adenosyltransferase [Bacteroidota bacterium]
MAFKIYTKTGDQGTTALIGGTRIPKNHIRIEAYGTVDELNSWLGLIADLLQDEPEKKVLKTIQNILFTIGSSLACDPEKDTKMMIPELLVQDITILEQEIDRMELQLPALSNFVLPGGQPVASHVHIARCVCRRAERICVAIQQENQTIDVLVIQYLNRLSDYLFVFSRYILHTHGGEETIWKVR